MFDESAEIVITPEEANAFFDQVCQLRRPDGKTMSQTEIGEHLGVDQSSVSRNQGDRKVGKDVREEMYKSSQTSWCCEGSPIGDRGRGGRRSIAPSFRAYPTGQSQRTWV